MSMKILIADDDRTLHISLRKPFINEGFEVVDAYDGLEAIRMVREEQPDILFLDVTMPGLDGRDACKKIRQYPEGKNLYIVMLTAKDQQFDRLVGFEVGADEYVTKPCNLSFLLRILEKIRLKSQQSSGDSGS